MYEGIKTAIGPTQNKTAPLKSTTGEFITDKEQQMERWVEHYSDFYSRQDLVTTSALDAIKCLPVMGELDNEPATDELSNAINSLALRKVPGIDGIPPDLIKHCKTTLLQPLHEVLCECWKEGAVPQDVMLRLSPSAKTGENAVTETTTGASPYSALWAKSLLGSFWSDYRH